MNEMYTSSSPIHWSKIFWLVMLLGLTSLYTIQVIARQNNVNPWVSYPIHQTRIVFDLAIDWPHVIWLDKPGFLEPARILLKNLETNTIQDLTGYFPCDLIGSGFGDLALDGEWLVGSFGCNYPSTYEIFAFNLNSLELVHILPPPGLPPEQKYADEPAIYGNLVVWKQRDWTWSQSELLLFDLQSRTVSTITTPPPSTVDWHPDIYQDWVAWYRLNLDTGERFVGLFNLSSREQITIPITATPSTWVSLDEQYVVWSDRRSGDNDIYGYDLINRQEIALITDPLNQGNAIIDNRMIFYHDYGPPRTLRMYHLDTQQTHIIYEQLPDEGLNQLIDLNQGTALWMVALHTSPGQRIIYVAQQLPERFYLPVLGRP
ncbi:MAG: hypothetical protein KJ063_15855 [Anaerolineae bacterium]|nr:hypothetical protein [Anaerolineae bacterium]